MINSLNAALMVIDKYLNGDRLPYRKSIPKRLTAHMLHILKHVRHSHGTHSAMYHDYKVTVFEARVLFENFFGRPLALAIAGSPFLDNSSRLL